MAKLADALASGASDRKVMGVQVPLRAQKGKSYPLWVVFPFYISQTDLKFKLSEAVMKRLNEIPRLYIGITLRVLKNLALRGFSFPLVFYSLSTHSL